MSQINTLPNILSAIRISFLPIIIWGVAVDSLLGFFIALAFVAMGEILDLTDGYIARTRNVVSDIGKVLDPLADTLIHISLYIVFLVAGTADLWAVIVMYVCTICVAYYRTVAASFGFVMAARPWGKIKANFQAYGALLVIVLMAYRAILESPPVGTLRLVLTGILAATFITIMVYCVVFKIRERPLWTAVLSALGVGALAVAPLWWQPSIIFNLDYLYVGCRGVTILVTLVTLWAFIDYSRFFVRALLDWSRKTEGKA